MSLPKKSRTDRAAQGSAPTWIGTCSAWAMRRPPRSQIAVEKSRLELRICEYEVRSIASPISSTMACSRCCTTETVTGSTSATLVSCCFHRQGNSMAEPVQVHIIGASGRSGATLCRSLQADGIAIVPIVRDAAKYPGARIADLTNPPALHAALSDATHIVSAAHARFAAAVIAAAPPDAQLILLGSTRKFTHWP